MTLERFATLPYELKIHVIELACAPAPSYLDTTDGLYDRPSRRRPSP